MPFCVFPHRDNKKDSDKSTRCKTIDTLSKIWSLGIFLVLGYFSIVYLLPLFKIVGYFVIPYKMIIEGFICSIPILTGILLNHYQMFQNNYTVSQDKDVFFVYLNNRIIGISCLEIISTSGSINIES